MQDLITESKTSSHFLNKGPIIGFIMSEKYQLKLFNFKIIKESWKVCYDVESK